MAVTELEALQSRVAQLQRDVEHALSLIRRVQKASVGSDGRGTVYMDLNGIQLLSTDQDSADITWAQAFYQDVATQANRFMRIRGEPGLLGASLELLAVYNLQTRGTFSTEATIDLTSTDTGASVVSHASDPLNDGSADLSVSAQGIPEIVQTVANDTYTTTATLGINGLSLNAALALASLTADPGSPSDGWILYRSDTDAFRGRVNGAWVNLLTDAFFGGATSIGTTVDPINDQLLIYDASASAIKKVGIEALLAQLSWWKIESDFAFDDEKFTQVATGGGGAGSSVIDGENSHPGIYQLSTGTTSAGAAGQRSALTGLKLGGGEFRFVSIIRIPTLSDGTETFTVRVGFGDSGSADGTDAVFFRYTHSVNSGQWVLVARDNGSETTSNTSSAPVANTWYRMEIVINAAGTSASFYIDGAAVGSALTALPTGATETLGVLAGSIVKSAGTTARTLDIDYCRALQHFTTAR